MKLSDLIRGKLDREVAKANPANSAKDARKGEPTLAGLATSALANPGTPKAANDVQAKLDGCAGALVDPDAGAYLPWGPYLSPADVQRMRGELFDMIDELCRFEGWSLERRHDTMTRAVCGPLSDLLPNIEYFHAKVSERRAEAEAAALLAARSWRFEGR